MSVVINPSEYLDKDIIKFLKQKGTLGRVAKKIETE